MTDSVVIKPDSGRIAVWEMDLPVQPDGLERLVQPDQPEPPDQPDQLEKQVNPVLLVQPVLPEQQEVLVLPDQPVQPDQLG
jgi:hypothetical protein